MYYTLGQFVGSSISSIGERKRGSELRNEMSKRGRENWLSLAFICWFRGGKLHFIGSEAVSIGFKSLRRTMRDYL